MYAGDLYILAIVATAAFVSPFHPFARIVVAAWMVAHVAFMAMCWFGISALWAENIANPIGHLLCFIVGSKYLRQAVPLDMVAWGLSAAMLCIDIVVIVLDWNGLDSRSLWIAILTLAFAQLAILPPTMDWQLFRTAVMSWCDTGSDRFFRVRHG